MGQSSAGLFGQEVSGKPEKRRKHFLKDMAHAAQPGSGQKGETCGTCKNRIRINYHNRTYNKCGLMKGSWTHGPGTDIRCKDNACKFWARRKGKQPTIFI